MIKRRKDIQKKWPSKGVSFEKAVAAVQKLMAPNATVTHNERLRDRHGHCRQFDVVIRGKLGGHEILGVIECKDLKKRVGTPEVDAFVTKARDVHANVTLLASGKGFTKPALEKAKDYGIGTISLLPKDPRDSGFSVGLQWYAELYCWAKVRFRILLVKQKTKVEKLSPEEVRWRGHKVLDWFRRELVTTYAQEKKLGWLSLQIKFDKVRRFEVGTTRCFVKGILFQALRTCEKKTRWIQIHGDAFFDWNKEQIMIPPRGSIVTDAWLTDLSDWRPYVGDIPQSIGFLDWRLKLYRLHFDPKAHVVDLMKL